VSPVAQFAYGLDAGVTGLSIPSDVQPYNIVTNGALSPITGTAQQLGANPRTARGDPSGKFLFVAGDASGTWIFSIQTAAPAGTLLKVGQIATTTGTVSRDVAINPTTTFAYVANGSTGVETYSIAANGNLTRSGSVVAAGTTPIRLVVTPNGKFLYVVNQGSNNVSAFSIGTTGALTSVGNIAAGSGPSAIAVDPSSAFVFVTNQTDGTLTQYSIGTTGALTSVQTFNTGAGPAAVVVTK